jgi:hypothetical protein
VLEAFRVEVEMRLRPGGDLSAMMAGWSEKLSGAVLRLAGLLHLGDHFGAGIGMPVSEQVIQRAITIGRYLISHAQAAFAEMGADPAVDVAKRILGWVERLGLKTFSKSDAYQALRGNNLGSPDELHAPLHVLVQYGHIRLLPEPPRPKGGRPSQRYEVSPLWTPMQKP